MSAKTRHNRISARRRLPAFILVLLVVALCVAGVIYKGAEVTQVNVNDGGIWVTNKSKQMVGHLDYEARILDGALSTEATSFDVGQAGETVTVSDLTSSTVAPVNVTQVSLGSPTALPAGSAVMQGGYVLDGSASPDRSKNLKPLLTGKDIVAWAALASANRTDRAVLDYVAALAEATREDESSLLGVSTRGAIGMVRCARVWAAAQGRNFVLPDDSKALAVPVWAHRVIVDPDAAFSGATAEGVIQRALTSVPAPAVGA